MYRIFEITLVTADHESVVRFLKERHRPVRDHTRGQLGVTDWSLRATADAVVFRIHTGKQKRRDTVNSQVGPSMGSITHVRAVQNVRGFPSVECPEGGYIYSADARDEDSVPDEAVTCHELENETRHMRARPTGERLAYLHGELDKALTANRSLERSNEQLSSAVEDFEPRRGELTLRVSKLHAPVQFILIMFCRVRAIELAALRQHTTAYSVGCTVASQSSKIRSTRISSRPCKCTKDR